MKKLKISRRGRKFRGGALMAAESQRGRRNTRVRHTCDKGGE